MEKEIQETDAESESGPIPIAMLKEKGINANDIKKLEEAGFHSVEAVTFKAKKDLMLIKGLSEAKLDKILEAAKQLTKGGFQTAAKFFELRKNIIHLSTGSS